MAKRASKKTAFATAVDRYQRLLERLAACEEARDDLVRFAQLMMPDYKDPEDVNLSRYIKARHIEVLANGLQMVETGKIKRLIVNMPPRMGKSQLASKFFIPWYVGRNPANSVIFGTYNQTFAEDFGRAVRDTMENPVYGQIFENSTLRKNSKASDRLETEAGGIMAFLGRGGAATGRGANLIVVDDALKNREEADSVLVREAMWTWFTQAILTRFQDENGRVILIQTRWHEDDLVGRITDPTNPHYDREEAKKWHIIDLPALAIGDDDPLGRKPGEALWPEKFSVSYLKSLQRTDPRGFNALYQGRPAPENGAFFLLDYIKPYKNYMLPKREDMRVYIASDHAVSSRQDRDKTCIIPMGVDRDNNIWILPDVWWRGTSTDVVVDAMLGLIKKYKPIFWWAERGHITKSIGPFLRKRMMEEQIHCSIIEISPTTDKQSRAQSIQARMAMGKVFFPDFTPWFAEARDQLMKFPNGSRDDFVDALAYLGLGMALHVPASASGMKLARDVQDGAGGPGTYGWLKAQTKAQERRSFLSEKSGGW